MKRLYFLLLLSFFPVVCFPQLYPYDTRTDGLDVLTYRLALDFRQMDQNILQAKATLVFTPLASPLDSLILDLKGLTVDSVLKQGQALNFVQLGETLRIDLGTPVASLDSLSVYYGGQPVQDATFGGFYFEQGFAFNVGVSLNALPHNYGRVWFPCLDNFIDRAFFDYEMWVPGQKMATAGGILVRDSLLPSGDRYLHYRSGHSYPSYLASVAVGSFELMQDTVWSQNGTAVPVVLAARAQDTLAFRQATANLASAFHIFESSFGDFQYSKIGYSLVPITGGAMEHAENIAYPILLAASGLLYQDVLVHELSHSWWGNLATCRTAEDMWLNEGMAVYSEWRFNELFYGRQAYLERYRNAHKSLLQFAHHEDQGYWPLSGMPQQHTYSSTTYSKGADFVHSLRAYLGDSAFFAGLKGALAATALQDWDAEAFRLALQQAVGINLQDFFQDWIFQGGWPLVIPDRWHAIPGQPGGFRVHLAQFTRGRNAFCSGLPLELTLFDAQGQTERHTVVVSGAIDSVDLSVQLTPVWAIANLNEALSLAETMVDTVLTGEGNRNLNYANWGFTLPMGNTQSYRVLASNRWTEPGGWKSQFQLNGQRHWALYLPEGLPQGTKALLNYNGRTLGNNAWLDNELMPGGEDSLVLLYRPARHVSWETVSDDPNRCQHLPGPSLSDKIGAFELTNPASGEYVLARRVLSGYEEAKPSDDKSYWYPNPVRAGELLALHAPCFAEGQATLTNIQGQRMVGVQILEGGKYLKLPEYLSAGVYLLWTSASTCSIPPYKIEVLSR